MIKFSRNIVTGHFRVFFGFLLDLENAARIKKPFWFAKNSFNFEIIRSKLHGRLDLKNIDCGSF